MRLIVITAPEPLPGEARALTALLEAGADRLHLRRPGASEEELAALLEAIPSGLRPRISLHDHHGLARRGAAGGIHLNGRNPEPPEGFRGPVSRSCHSLDELDRWRNRCDYLFLSPLFDSISKQGYRAAFPLQTLREAARHGTIDSRVMALGGVDPDRMPQVRELGFGGAAILGYLWNDYRPDDLDGLLQRFERLRAATGRTAPREAGTCGRRPL